ncbi:hypothetical protein K488DRAFT_74119 [Vararia minispora EC-137]|uniref:Uncharacterized protein n=1 Tax=Vararia minispora EC-137 TaxID=1314806 RepID=A0ACB8Q8K0_9AGAM|nr:hypothetical protein K488DRAFT_74119 [Vararia minispora EC-137]
MHSVKNFLVLFAFFAVIQVGAGHFIPRDHNGMLVAAEHRHHTATHQYGAFRLLSSSQMPHHKPVGSSMNPGNRDGVIKTLDIAVTEASTVATNPAVPSVTSTDATTPTASLDFSYMMSPVYTWGHTLLQKLFPAESVQNSDIVAAAVHLAAQPEFIATVAAMSHEEVLYMVALTYVGMKASILQDASGSFVLLSPTVPNNGDQTGATFARPRDAPS